MQHESNNHFFEHLQQLELRYEAENQLMEIVRKGQWQKVQPIINDLPRSVLEKRIDPVRDARNYSIILNTLMRKAAEQGGAPLIHLDRLSSEFALRIERTNHWDHFLKLWQELIEHYCHLVRKHAAKHYSPLVQKVVSRIELDLTADLRLSSIAKGLNVNASYLSNLFRQETGQTLTDYVTAKRMEHGANLLKTTRLPISVVAQRCGISDDNYFAKIFKKYSAMTPTQYRNAEKC